MQIDPSDGGNASRKFRYAIGTSLLIVIGAFCAGLSDSAKTLYAEMVAGLLGALGLYMGANVGSKWVISKTFDEAKPAPLNEHGAPDDVGPR